MCILYAFGEHGFWAARLLGSTAFGRSFRSGRGDRGIGMDAKRYARAGGTVAVLTVLILAGFYAISIMLGHPEEGRIRSQTGPVQPGRSTPSTRPSGAPRPKAHPPIVTTAGIPA